MTAIACPHCNHQTEEPNAWQRPDTAPIDCLQCGKTFSQGSGEEHAADLANQSLEVALQERRAQLAAEVENPTPIAAMPSKKTIEPTQQCRFCRSEISVEATKCPACQEWLVQRKNPPSSPDMVMARQFNPGVAAVLSFLIPGLGQIYKTQIFWGIYWLMVVYFFYWTALLLDPILLLFPIILHLACIASAASINPVRTK